MFQIISAVNYLHSFETQVLHRDIKLENMLLDEKENIKLADFGCANLVQSKSYRSTKLGTLAYMAPEIVKGQ
jgi:5'-AMP-activated protein kinase catalytic alpha subunit